MGLGCNVEKGKDADLRNLRRLPTVNGASYPRMRQSDPRAGLGVQAVVKLLEIVPTALPPLAAFPRLFSLIATPTSVHVSMSLGCNVEKSKVLEIRLWMWFLNPKNAGLTELLSCGADRVWDAAAADGQSAALHGRQLRCALLPRPWLCVDPACADLFVHISMSNLYRFLAVILVTAWSIMCVAATKR